MLGYAMYYITLFLRKLDALTSSHRAYNHALRALTAVCNQLLEENQRLKRNYDILLRQLNQEPTFEAESLLTFIVSGDGVRVNEITAHFGITYPTAKKQLDLLIEEGKIQRRDKKYYGHNPN